jgi:hypothetical protein
MSHTSEQEPANIRIKTRENHGPIINAHRPSKENSRGLKNPAVESTNAPAGEVRSRQTLANVSTGTSKATFIITLAHPKR